MHEIEILANFPRCPEPSRSLSLEPILTCATSPAFDVLRGLQATANYPWERRTVVHFTATALYPQRLEPASNGSFAQKECLATESMPFPLRIQQQTSHSIADFYRNFGQSLAALAAAKLIIKIF
jgi:hypothetical protein